MPAFDPRPLATIQRQNVAVPDALIAHRGAPLLAPENTLPAMRAAAARGARWVEVDVKLTRDMQPVIIHDDRVDRTTNGRGFVANMSFEDIRQLDAGSFFSPDFAGTRVPTLEELVETVLDLDIGLQLELKPTAGDDIETAEVALAAMKDLWPVHRGRLFITSFSIRSIHAAARLLPDVPRAFAVVVPPRDPKALLAETRCQILHLQRDFLPDDALKIMADSGIEYAVATINEAQATERFFAAGAQTILSDIPDLFERTAPHADSL
ncbi:glycerophosphodiester phosphodiesterase family protein [Rhizobium straminoryzae]|uniref:Glycerophosphoryl diester phosphodiesterase n=1 Tax=Rhizobium straminoryzae TaxID=1387186 RepID=A0A549TA23_9HYPH|nr:glycerophosphodiester phosphodiesterase family protein [Rhizobium straminoryzae]TRL38705.1 glycerophosphoryl diester phosphodiesterase [Rhizobium straminoryzae]